MSDCILAIDQGTTNTKVLLVSADGKVLARASRPVAISYPRPSWVEQDAGALWLSVEEAMEECLGAAGIARPKAVAVTNQRETVAVWERATGRPAGPCAVWQCTRGTELCRELAADPRAGLVRDRTGLELDPMFSASKLRWLLDHAAPGKLCAGTIDSWVLWNLTGGAVHACDTTNASRTLLMDLRACQWDPDLCSLFGVPLESLPGIRPSGSLFGETVARGRLPASVPVASLVGDSHGAHFGHAGFRPGAVKSTYGTGSSLMMSTDGVVLSSHGLSSTVAFARGDEVTYALEGNIYSTGATVQWLGDLFGIGSAEVAALAAGAEDSGGVCLVPAFAGLGAPYWNSRARGVLTGLTRGVTKAHLARAAVESIAFQIHDVSAAMEADSGERLPRLLADGGASRNDHLMQLQADLLDREVQRSASADLSALGAAYLAGLTVGMWSSLDEIEALPRPRDRFEPRMEAGRREQMLTEWRAAVERTLHGCGGAGA
jgi:glycerol kinase